MVSKLDEQKMVFRRFTIKSLARILILYGISIGCVDAAVRLDYISPMGEENWQMSGSRLRCGLTLTIPNYGVAYFEQFAAKPAHFVLNNWQRVERSLPAIVYAKPPVWKPGGQTFLVTKTTLNPGEFGFFLPRDPTIQLLNYLSDGYQTSFHYLSEQGFPISVSLSPIRFQKVYARYQRCLGGLLPFDFATVRLSVLLFETDSFELSDKVKEQLKKVAEYCRADHSVKRVKIAGYTDDTGRKSYNNAVSEARAKSVKEYLLSQGIQENRLSITWYGVKFPAAPNNTDAGKTINRRVVVKLFKQ